MHTSRARRAQVVQNVVLAHLVLPKVLRRTLELCALQPAYKALAAAYKALAAAYKALAAAYKALAAAYKALAAAYKALAAT